jgi:hypothetical protein
MLNSKSLGWIEIPIKNGIFIKTEYTKEYGNDFALNVPCDIKDVYVE